MPPIRHSFVGGQIIARPRGLNAAAQAEKLADIQNIFGMLLDSDISRRTLRPGIMAGLKVLVDAMKAAAPMSKGPRRQKVGKALIKPGRMRRAPGRSMKKDRKLHQVVGKAGLNVGKKKFAKGSTKNDPDRPIAGNYAPHAHLVALGTSLRVRDRIGGRYAGIEAAGRGNKVNRRTGIMPANRFVRRAAAGAAGRAIDAAKVETIARLNKELSTASDAGRIVAQINLVYSL